MCINCEGRIPVSADVCPFCAAHQTSHNSFQAPIFENQSLEDSLTSLYTPPYQGKRPQFEGRQSYEPVEEERHYKEVREKTQIDPLMDATVKEEAPRGVSSFLPTLLLTLGANFAIIGLMQLFFSKDGVLRLEWNANYWFFYCLASAPLIYFGFKKTNHLTE